MFLVELLNEGLKKNDLDFLVNDTLSVDQYKGKFSDESLVVVFFVKDKQAAKELEDFIQRSSIKTLLLTELNTDLDKNNYYHLYLDFERKKEFIEDFLQLLNDINKLTNVKEWKMKVGKNKFVYRINEENLLKFINFDQKN